MKFDKDRIYAECYNPNGLLALPVGEVWIKTTKAEYSVMHTDVVYGSDLNKILDSYQDIIEISFRAHSDTILLYRAF